jgi:hypothetical protein
MTLEGPGAVEKKEPYGSRAITVPEEDGSRVTGEDNMV